MNRSRLRLATLLLPLVTAVGCASSGLAPPAAPSPPPYAAYVLLGESPAGEPMAWARLIVDPGAPCPELVGGERPLPTRRRANPHGFAVDVCEVAVPFDTALQVAGGEPSLPVAHRRVGRVAVVGDTGCKPDDQSGCGMDDPAWPFPRLAAAAAARLPDLVLHLGDYDYRGTPASFERTVDGRTVKTYYYDAGDGAEPAERCEVPGPYYSQNSTGNQDADAWDAWWLDFFQPAAPLLAAAPWIATRGNHELCSHAGPGWLYFLDAGSELPDGGGQLSCPSQDGEGPAPPHLVLVPPRVVALDGLTVAALDSANACDELTNFTPAYREQLAAVAQRLADRPAWLIGHRPVWGVQGDAGGPPFTCDDSPGSGPAPAYTAINRTLQCALAGEVGRALLPKLDLLLSGHMHRFEQLVFSGGGRPPTLVVGSSGVAEDPQPPHGTFQQTVDGEPAAGFSVEAFALLEMNAGDDGAWTGRVVTPDPDAFTPSLEACGSAAVGVNGAPPLCVETLP